MRARTVMNSINTGTVARDYVRLVKGGCRSPLREADKQRGRGAQDILETIRDQEKQEGDLDIDIAGKVIIQQMDRDLEDFGLVPYWYTDLARSRGEGIYPGAYVLITGDPSGKRYRTMGVSFSRQAIRIRDDEEKEFVLPWDMAEPCQGEENDRPYWFTSLAKDRSEDLQIGDYVSLTGTDEKHELMDTIWSSGSVRIRAVGHIEQLFLPWRFIRPYKEESSK